jgi:hypothetical protein
VRGINFCLFCETRNWLEGPSIELHGNIKINCKEMTGTEYSSDM